MQLQTLLAAAYSSLGRGSVAARRSTDPLPLRAPPARCSYTFTNLRRRWSLMALFARLVFPASPASSFEFQIPRSRPGKTADENIAAAFRRFAVPRYTMMKCSTVIHTLSYITGASTERYRERHTATGNCWPIDAFASVGITPL